MTQKDSIYATFTKGFDQVFKWRNGQRKCIMENKVRLKSGITVSPSYIDFWKYLKIVFKYLDFAFPEKQLTSIYI
ncbi:hypothetical protein LCGC14_2286890 [marine sediment metagenome]|uniref:Uncharacterized protein n=1 Tax=marine sediment metagenome TaxID=412755 RepID=A0A0F8VCN0_9ZZZZ